jgi:hypothetical protein
MVISHFILVYEVYQESERKLCLLEFMNMYGNAVFCYAVIYVIIEHKLILNLLVLDFLSRHCSL